MLPRDVAAELDQQTVAHRLGPRVKPGDPAMVLGNFGIHQFAPDRLQH